MEERGVHDSECSATSVIPAGRGVRRGCWSQYRRPGDGRDSWCGISTQRLVWARREAVFDSCFQPSPAGRRADPGCCRTARGRASACRRQPSSRQSSEEKELARRLRCPSLDGRLMCLISNTSAEETRFACSPLASFHSGVGFAVLISNERPPDAPTSLEVVEVASNRVKNIRIQFRTLTREARVNADGGFRFVADAAAPARKRPTSITSVDRAGHVVGVVRGPIG